MTTSRSLGTALLLPLLLLLLLLAATGTAGADDDLVIHDPLAHDGAEGGTPAAPPPLPRPRLWHAEVAARAPVQLDWRDGEDVAGLYARGRFWVAQTVSPRFGYVVGVRLDHVSRARDDDDAALSYEARAWEAYVDVALGASGAAGATRLRAGNQVVTWGRLDLASAADMLAVHDWRWGPSLDPEDALVPTPTLRLTHLFGARGTLEAAWTPFFTADRVSVAGASWALLGPNAPPDGQAIAARLQAGLDASSFARFQEQLALIGAPAPRPDLGEVAVHGAWRAGGFDTGLTWGWVRNKAPALEIDPVLTNYLVRGSLGDALALQAALDEGRELIVAHYDRHHQLAADVETVAGPLTLAAELGFTPARTLLVADPTTGLPTPHQSAVVQGGVKGGWTPGDHAFSVELGGLRAGDPPPGGRSYYLLGDGQAFAYALALAHVAAFGDHELDAAALVTTSDPWSLAVQARWRWRLSERWAVGLGLAAYAGPTDNAASAAAVSHGLSEGYVTVELRP